MKGQEESPIEIPSNFVQWGETLKGFETKIKEGSYLRCYAAEIFNPSKFYVNLVEMWNEQEEMMAKLQDFISSYLDVHERWKNETVPRLELLAPGQYVLCKYFGPKDNRTEWHRAMILRNPAFEDKPGLVNKFKSIGKLSESEILSIGLKVVLVDYGTVHWTTILDLKYMMRSVNTEFPIAGIECELYFPPDYGTILNKKNQSWERLASDELYELLDDRVLGVTFHKRKNIRLAGQKEITSGRWIVSVDVIEGLKKSKVVDLNQDPHKDLTLSTAAGFDPSLAQHPDGLFSNTVAVSNHNVSKNFLKWIKN